MKRFSLKRNERITSNNEFRNVLARGKRIKTPVFEIRLMYTGRELNRLGISIARPLGTAVFRNRVKRTVREWFRLNKYEWLQKMDIIFLLRRKITDLSLLQDELTGLLEYLKK